MRRVVVTGMGIVSSIGNTTQEVLASLREARSGIVKAETYAQMGFRSQVHGAPTLKPEEMVDRRAMRFHAMGTAWNHVAMDQAIRDAGLDEGVITHPRTGIVMGSGGPSAKTLVDSADTARSKGPKRVGPFAVPKSMSSTASATLATWFKIRGVNYSISSACATSNHCIGNAYELIQYGKQDVIFAGGCEELDWTMSVLFDAMGAMSSNYNDRPSVASRAYDKNRDGFVIAGGAGVLVLEELQHAKARGAKIYGEIAGYCVNSDATDYVLPNPERQAECVRKAIAHAGMTIEDIDLVNTHATSTPQGDIQECLAIAEVFKSRSNPPHINNTKSFIGHAMGAAGALELAGNLPSFDDLVVHPTINVDELDPQCDIPGLVINQPKTAKRVDAILNNSFGMLGINSTLVIKRFVA